MVSRLAGEVAKGRREIGKLKRDEVRLTRLVEEIARALAARRPEGRTASKRVDSVADA